MDEGVVSDVCIWTKNVHEHVAESEKVIDKVHSILESLNIPISYYDYELNKFRDTVSDFSESLKGTRIRNSHLDDSLSMI